MINGGIAMPFEEEFPSLEGKGTDDIKVDCMNELIFHYTDIQKHCLDKQKVREAMEKFKYWYETGRYSGNYSINYDKLKKELGL